MIDANERYILSLEKMLRQNQRALRDLIEAVDAYLGDPQGHRYGDEEALETNLEEARRVLSKTENW